MVYFRLFTAFARLKEWLTIFHVLTTSNFQHQKLAFIKSFLKGSKLLLLFSQSLITPICLSLIKSDLHPEVDVNLTRCIKDLHLYVTQPISLGLQRRSLSQDYETNYRLRRAPANLVLVTDTDKGHVACYVVHM